MKSNPRISVVMSVFNEEKYIRLSLESILNQSFQDFEIVIVDDASTDKSVEIINSIKDRRITLYKNTKNRGVAYTKNAAIKRAKGSWIAHMGADDVSFPFRLEQQMKYLDLHPEVDILGSQYVRGNIVETKVVKPPTSHQEIRAKTLFGAPMGHGTLLIRRSIFKKFQYDIRYKIAEDYEFLAKLSNKVTFANLNFPTYFYRKHENNTSESNSKLKKNIFEKILKGILDDWRLPYSQQELDIHLSFAGNVEHTRHYSSYEYRNWCNKLLKHNTTYPVYSQSALSRVISLYWRKNSNISIAQKLMNGAMLKVHVKNKLSMFGNLGYLLLEPHFHERYNQSN